MATARKVQQKRNETRTAPARRKAAPARKAAAPQKPERQKKSAPGQKKPAAPKLQRDTFRMTSAEFDELRKLKTRAKALGVPAKKSEILRAGLRTLHRMDDEHFAVLLAQVQNP